MLPLRFLCLITWTQNGVSMSLHVAVTFLFNPISFLWGERCIWLSLFTCSVQVHQWATRGGFKNLYGSSMRPILEVMATKGNRTLFYRIMISLQISANSWYTFEIFHDAICSLLLSLSFINIFLLTHGYTRLPDEWEFNKNLSWLDISEG